MFAMDYVEPCRGYAIHTDRPAKYYLFFYFPSCAIIPSTVRYVFFITIYAKKNLMEILSYCLWLLQGVAITQENSLLDNTARIEGWVARFPMFDWVGGRTSEMSAVGLLPAALQACFSELSSWLFIDCKPCGNFNWFLSDFEIRELISKKCLLVHP